MIARKIQEQDGKKNMTRKVKDYHGRDRLDCDCGICSGEDAAIDAMERGIVLCETNYEGENF
jgi:hypothetical protein